MKTLDVHGLRAAIYEMLGWVYRAKSTPPPILALMNACGLVRSSSGLFQCDGWVQGQAHGDQPFSIHEIKARPAPPLTHPTWMPTQEIPAYAEKGSHSPALPSDFQGLVISLDHDQSFAARTVITADRGASNPQQMQEMKPVGLVSSEFERLFEVYSDDQVEARSLLTPDFVERLTHFKQGRASRNIPLTAYNNVQFIFLGQKFHVILNSQDHIRFGEDTQITDIDQAVHKVLGEVNTLFWVLDALQALQSRLCRQGTQARDAQRRDDYRARLQALETAVRTASAKGQLLKYGSKRSQHHTEHAYMVSEPLQGLLTPRF